MGPQKPPRMHIRALSSHHQTEHHDLATESSHTLERHPALHPYTPTPLHLQPRPAIQDVPASNRPKIHLENVCKRPREILLVAVSEWIWPIFKAISCALGFAKC